MDKSTGKPTDTLGQPKLRRNECAERRRQKRASLPHAWCCKRKKRSPLQEAKKRGDAPLLSPPSHPAFFDRHHDAPCTLPFAPYRRTFRSRCINHTYEYGGVTEHETQDTAGRCLRDVGVNGMASKNEKKTMTYRFENIQLIHKPRTLLV